MTAINWGERLQAGIDTFTETIEKLDREKQALALNRDMLSNLLNYNAGFRHASIHQDGGGDWKAWVPPYKPEHFDGTNILGPYGDTYFPTLEEAAEFMNSVMRDEQPKSPETLAERLGLDAEAGILLDRMLNNAASLTSDVKDHAEYTKGQAELIVATIGVDSDEREAIVDEIDKRRCV